MSRASAKLEKVRADRDRLFSEGKFYEALQLYKTLYSRASVKKSWAEARDLVVEGATALLQQQQSNSGGELSMLLIELYTKSKQACEQEQVDTILTLASAFPASADSASPPVEAKVAFLKAAIKWSTTPTSNNSGHPSLHLALAHTYAGAAEFSSAHQHFLRSGGATTNQQNYEEDATCLQAWAQNGGAPSELDLFFLRGVLQYLCLEDLAGATALLQWVRRQLPAVADEPLLHFGEFLVEVTTRSREAAPLFDLLRHKYSLALTRDPSLEAYVAKIGEVFFGRQVQKGFMESLLGGLSSSAPTATSVTASPTAASIASGSPMQMSSTDVD